MRSLSPLAVALALLTFTACGDPPDDNGTDVDTGDYAIGEEGPAGGIIFFEDSDDDYDFTYLEAAAEDYTPDGGEPIFSWAAGHSDAFFMEITASEVGTGESNTERIVAELEEDEQTGRAAQIAADYDGGDHSDWFLPSEGELQLMYDNLHAEGLGDFRDDNYWSSTEFDINYARSLNFNSGDWHDWTKTFREYVRPIRAF